MPIVLTADKVKESEIHIASFIVEHNLSFNAVDHLVQLIKNINVSCAKDDVKQISCNRTKCTKIVENCIGVHDLEVIVGEMKST
jgi:hypothetical protein